MPDNGRFEMRPTPNIKDKLVRLELCPLGSEARPVKGTGEFYTICTLHGLLDKRKLSYGEIEKHAISCYDIKPDHAIRKKNQLRIVNEEKNIFLVLALNQAHHDSKIKTVILGPLTPALRSPFASADSRVKQVSTPNLSSLHKITRHVT